MKIRFVLYVSIAAILVTAAGAFAEARKDRATKIKTTNETSILLELIQL